MSYLGAEGRQYDRPQRLQWWQLNHCLQCSNVWRYRLIASIPNFSSCVNTIFNNQCTINKGLFKMYQILWIFFLIAVSSAQNSTCATIRRHIMAHSHAMLGDHQVITTIRTPNEITGLHCIYTDEWQLKNKTDKIIDTACLENINLRDKICFTVQ